MKRPWMLGAVLAACFAGSSAIVIFGRDTSPPEPNIVVLPNVYRPTSTTTTTSSTRPLLGVACVDRQGFPYRAEKCR